MKVNYIYYIGNQIIIQVAFAKNKEAVKVLKEARHIENEHRTKVNAHFDVLTQTQNTTRGKLNLAK